VGSPADSKGKRGVAVHRIHRPGSVTLEEVLKVYFFGPLEKEISVEDMQKIVDANEKLVKELKDGSK